MNWEQPYRSIDYSGSPESAASVGWDWLYPIIRAEHAKDPVQLELDRAMAHCVLYRGTEMIAGYFIFRDPMNFSVLMRWKVQDSDG